MERAVNPYAPPKSEVEVSNVVLQPVSASRIRRLINYLIDTTVTVAILVFVFIIISVIFEEEAVADFEEISDVIIGPAIVIVYYTMLEGLSGRSIGKWVTGTKVVSSNGQPASFIQVACRSFLRLIPFDVLTFFTSSRRGLHDWLAGTYVVSTRPNTNTQNDTTSQPYP